MMGDISGKDIFLCYATKNREFVEKIRCDLERNNYSTWMDYLRIEGGDDWERQIESNLRNCKVFIVTITDDSIKSDWVKKECFLAENLGKKRIPLLRKGAELPFHLINLQYIDFRQEDEQLYKKGILDLLEILKKHLPNDAAGINGAAAAATDETNAMLTSEEGSNNSTSSLETNNDYQCERSSVVSSIGNFIGKLWQMKNQNAKACRVCMRRQKYYNPKHRQNHNMKRMVTTKAKCQESCQSKSAASTSISHQVQNDDIHNVQNYDSNINNNHDNQTRREAVEKLLFCVPHGWVEEKRGSETENEATKDFLCQARLGVRQTEEGREASGVSKFLESVQSYLWNEKKYPIHIKEVPGKIVLKLMVADKNIGPLEFTPDGPTLKLFLEGIDKLYKSLLVGEQYNPEEIFVGGSWKGCICILFQAPIESIHLLIREWYNSKRHLDLGYGIVLTGIYNLFMAENSSSDQKLSGENTSTSSSSLDVQQHDLALQYASLRLQNDKQVALAEVKKNPDAIKYVDEELKRDPDVLIAAGMLDEDHEDRVLPSLMIKEEGHSAINEAIRLYSLPANQGHDSAQFNLAWSYANGEGVSKDLSEAVRLYTLAANQGHAGAQSNLALLYANGKGVEKNMSEAIRLYTLAINQGNVNAQFNLALCYKNGEGVEKNISEAIRLYTLAANQGDRNLYKPNRIVPEDESPHVPRLGESLKYILEGMKADVSQFLFEEQDQLSDFSAYKRNEDDDIIFLIPSSDAFLDALLENDGDYWCSMQEVLTVTVMPQAEDSKQDLSTTMNEGHAQGDRTTTPPVLNPRFGPASRSEEIPLDVTNRAMQYQRGEVAQHTTTTTKTSGSGRSSSPSFPPLLHIPDDFSRPPATAATLATKTTPKQKQTPVPSRSTDKNKNPKELPTTTSSEEEQYWLSKVQTKGQAIRDAPVRIRNNKTAVLLAVEQDGLALQFASPQVRNDMHVVNTAVRQNVEAFQYAAPELRHDKDFALSHIQSNPDHIKHVHDDLKRDPDILIAAGMYDAVVRSRSTEKHKKIVLSTSYFFNVTSQSEAMNMIRLLKNNSYIQNGNFQVYISVLLDMESCDPEWTRFDWPCRGTIDTCQYDNILTDEGHPTDDCCWRYSFRSKLQEVKDTGGFMLQLVETGEQYGMVKDATLGMGQRIELDMANTMGVKVFQVYRPTNDTKVDAESHELPFNMKHIDSITKEISQWYSNECQDMSVTVIRP